MQKSHILFLFLFLISVASCKKKEISGLVAAYHFNNNILDEGDNGNHGTAHGAQLTKDRFGKENSAYYFNGTSAYIQSIVSNMPAIENPKTISYWFIVDQLPLFKDSLGAENIFAIVDSAAGIGLQFGYRAAGYHTLGFDSWYWGGQTVLESAHPKLNEWHHVAYTYDGLTHRFYIDGQQTAQSSVKSQLGTPNMLMLGNYPGGDQFFTGSLDEVLIYNRALLSAEVKLLYNKKE